MTINSLVDPKKRELVREAIRRKDASLLKRKPQEEPARTVKSDDKRKSGPHLSIFISSKNGLPFEEAFQLVESQKLIIASNKRLYNALNESNDWESIKDVFPCWSGTMTGYEGPGIPLGSVIEYVDQETKFRWIFPVPEKYQGMKDVILVAEHPDYSLEIKGNDRIVKAAVVDIIEKFPAESEKFYFTDPKHSIPFGNQVTETNLLQNLYRFEILDRIEKRVGPVDRLGSNVCKDGGHMVGLINRPSLGFGIAVESIVPYPGLKSVTKIQK